MLWFACAAPGAAQVQINEIMFHPLSNRAADAYVELHNTGDTVAALGGWRFTSGITFTFPELTLAPDAYCVVVADPDCFRTNHPGVTNLAGPWQGNLSRRGEPLVLVDSHGKEVDRVAYADNGEWASRVRAAIDYGHRGWKWLSAADEYGASLELVNPNLPNDFGANWACGHTNGSPGRVNSVLATHTAPLITGTRQEPALPKSTESVLVTTRIWSAPGQAITAGLHYRLDGATNFLILPMMDDGLHQDGAAGDGWFSARLPAQTNLAVVEFYIQAVDQDGLARTWPAPASNDGEQVQRLNALYQVYDTVETTPDPVYWLILTAADRAELEQINRGTPPPPYPTDFPTDSRAAFNGTFVSHDGGGWQLRYNVEIRNRGSSSRFKQPQSFRVNFQKDSLWEGVAGLNLNAQYPFLQVLGSALYQRSGLPAAGSRPAQLRVNGRNLAFDGPPSYGFYAANEVADPAYTGKFFPEDPNGNLYKCKRFSGTGADLAYLGSNPAPYQVNYFKRTNRMEDDWSDLVELAWVLDNASAATYVEEVGRVLNVRLWLRYFAMETLVVNMETCLGNGHLGLGYGDDYKMYFGRNDPRCIIVPHDLDTILAQGDTWGNPQEVLWRATANPRIARFLQTPEFAALYYEELLGNAERLLNPDTFGSLVEQVVGARAPELNLQWLEWFRSTRLEFLRSQIPQALTVQTTLPLVNGYYRTASNTLSLEGKAPVITCSTVKVNGVAADWLVWRGQWHTTNCPLQPGLNQVSVTCFDRAGNLLEERRMEVWQDAGWLNPVPPLVTNQVLTWSASRSPWLVTNELLVAENTTLVIEPGAMVFFSPNARLVVRGRIQALGTAQAPIHLGLQPDASGHWRGLLIGPSAACQRLSHVILDRTSPGTAAISALESQLELDHVSFANVPGTCIATATSSLNLHDSSFPAVEGAPRVVLWSLPSAGSCLIASNQFAGSPLAGTAIQAAPGGTPEFLLQILDNDFGAAGSPHLDLRGVSAFIAGNLFRQARAPTNQAGIACAVSASATNGQPAKLTLVRNVFHDCDYAVQAVGGSRIDLDHNTLFRMAKAALLLEDPHATNPAPASAISLAHNIIWETSRNFARDITTDSQYADLKITMAQNILSARDGLAAGSTNYFLDPVFRQAPAAEYQGLVRRDDFTPQPNSPALAAGAFHLDLGAVMANRLGLSGLPELPTQRRDFTLYAGGPGITTIRWGLDQTTWGKEQATTQPILLAGLPPGRHTINLEGKDLAGSWQPQAALSRTWQIATANPAPPIRINEILAYNSGGVLWDGVYPGLVELVNAGDAPLDLAGLSLSEASSDAPRLLIPPGHLLPPGGFLVLPEGGPGAAFPSLPFKLNRQGGRVDLYAIASQGETLVDSVVFGRQLPNRSIGRLPGGGWGLTMPTPGSANMACPAGGPASLKLNEWLVRPGGAASPGWVEIFNPSPLAASLAGVCLAGHSQPVPGWGVLPPLSFIDGGGFALFTATPVPTWDSTPLDFQLDPNYGAIGLFDPAGRVLDMVFYESQPADQPQGRTPDGGRAITALSQLTPGSANPSATGTNQPPATGTIRLQEIMAAGWPGRQGGLYPGAWIELHNPAAAAIDLAGLSLTDDPQIPRRWSFATNSLLAAGGYLVIACDGDSPASATNTGFNLSATGGTLFLFDSPARNSQLLDSLVYGLQVPDASLGRLAGPDGGWTLTQPTPEGPNLAVSLGNPSLLRINEWLAKPASGNDWFELFNPEPLPVTLAGLSLTDDFQDPRRHPLPPLSFIGTGSYAWRLFHADGDTSLGGDHVPFKLSASGDSLGLFDASQQAIDSVLFGTQADGISQGRSPDGADAIVSFTMTPTPGLANRPDNTTLDSDQDTMPDAWELAHGLNPYDAADRSEDPDHDGLTNEQEYRCGTDPHAARSRLDFTSIRLASGGVLLTFQAAANTSYSIQSCGDLRTSTWLNLVGFAAQPLAGPREWLDPSRDSGPRYYRLVTPQRR